MGKIGDMGVFQLLDLIITELKSRCWVAAHTCVKSHFRTCDVRAKVRAEWVRNCACGSACVWATFKVRFAIAHFYQFNAYAVKNDATFNLFST